MTSVLSASPVAGALGTAVVAKAPPDGYSLVVGTTSIGPKGFASGRPKMRVRKAAEARLSRHQTMVWFSWTDMRRF